MGSLLLGLYYVGELAFVGKVEVPFNLRHELHVRLAELAAPEPPFVTPPAGVRAARWVRPDLGCLVECSGLTGGPALRAPALVRVLSKADPKDCVLAQLEDERQQRRAG
jgi:ATP-dependent DNA ligase